MGDLGFIPYVFFVGRDLRLLNPVPRIFNKSWRALEKYSHGQQQSFISLPRGPAERLSLSFACIVLERLRGIGNAKPHT
jgi:hypothetical protein